MARLGKVVTWVVISPLQYHTIEPTAALPSSVVFFSHRHCFAMRGQWYGYGGCPSCRHAPSAPTRAPPPGIITPPHAEYGDPITCGEIIENARLFEAGTNWCGTYKVQE